MEALEDALLSAYRKQPGAAKYARVELDRDTADFRVYELLIPEDLEEELWSSTTSRRARSTRRPARSWSYPTRSSTGTRSTSTAIASRSRTSPRPASAASPR